MLCCWWYGVQRACDFIFFALWVGKVGGGVKGNHRWLRSACCLRRSFDIIADDALLLLHTHTHYYFCYGGYARGGGDGWVLYVVCCSARGRRCLPNAQRK